MESHFRIPIALKTQLNDIKNGSISERQLSVLIQFCRGVIESYFKHYTYSTKALCAKRGETITDLAIDCIAGVFARNQEGNFYILGNFISSLRAELETLPDREIFLAFKNFLICFADRQLARIYAQEDPQGAKISRNIKENIKNSSLFFLTADHRGKVLRPVSADALDRLPPFPLEELAQQFYIEMSQNRNIPDLLECLFRVLTGQSEYRRSIPQKEVVQLFKKIYPSYPGKHEDLTAQEPEAATEGLTDIEIQQIRSQVERFIFEKIISTYLIKGRLAQKEAGAIFRACCDVVSDWCSSGATADSYYEYLNRYLPVNKSVYEDTYRVKMEYLLRMAREEFDSRLNEGM